MDTLDNNRLEISISVWAKHQLLIQLDGALENSATKHKTDSFSVISGIDGELGIDLVLNGSVILRIVRVLDFLEVNILLSDDRLWKHAYKLTKQIDT